MAATPHGTDLPQVTLPADRLEEIIGAIVSTAAERIVAAQEQPGGLVVSKAWVYQDDGQVKKHGREKASWYVGWRDPDGRRHGKSCGSGREGRRRAKRLAAKIQAQLIEGTYGQKADGTWEEFRAEYERNILAGKSAATRRQALMSFRNFERVIKPGKVSGIKTQTVDEFTARRRQEKARYRRDDRAPKRGRKKPYAECGLVSPASVNADLRNLKAALAVAVEWGYLKELPRFRFAPEPEALPTYVTPADFDKLHEACAAARLPDIQGVTAAEWWRCLLTVAYLTGWRRGEFMGLRRDQADLDAGTVRLWNQKAGREDLVPLHPLVADALRRLPGFTPTFFHWPHHVRTLYAEFGRVQAAAGMAGRYTFHDLRRGFGTLAAGRMAPKVLQHLMRHRSLNTTLRYYVNPLADVQAAVDGLAVPKALRDGTGG